LAGNPPLLIIVGATAVGKTGLGIEIAKQLNGEIINADIRQIYQYMDIGTAKPTPAQQAAAIHHLLDIVPPDRTLGLAQYQHMAYTTIAEVTSRGKLPILIGGTGQYVTAVEEGWSIPEVPPDEDLRARLEAEADEHGGEHLLERLRQIDPEAAEKIHPNNVRRTIRALEVYEITGTPISILQRKQPPPYRIRVLGLTLEREKLKERADLRLEQMMQMGFKEEVEMLLERGYDPNLPAMSALGYRELASHLAGKMSLDEALEQTRISTHQFIRRQEIWFRGHDNGILWHNGNTMDLPELLDTLATWKQE